MKHVLMILSAFSILVFGGCSNQESAQIKQADKTEPGLYASLKPQSIPFVAASKQIGRTFFSFSDTGTVFLKDNEKKTITVQATPNYEPITSVQVVLEYDPERIKVTDVKEQEGLMVFQKTNDTEEGVILFVGAIPDGLYGDKIPVFEFTVESVAGTKGESRIEFLPEALHALLPDTNNTDTAFRQNIKPLVLSIL